MAKPTHQRSSPRARLSAVLVVLLCSGSQLASSLHDAFAAHEVCAEHGELVHASSPVRVVGGAEHGEVVHASSLARTFIARPAKPASPSTDHRPPTTVGDEADGRHVEGSERREEHGHDHCLVALLQQPGTPTDGQARPAVRLDGEGAASGLPAAGHSPRSPLAVAPKASPPVV